MRHTLCPFAMSYKVHYDGQGMYKSTSENPSLLVGCSHHPSIDLGLPSCRSLGLGVGTASSPRVYLRRRYIVLLGSQPMESLYNQVRYIEVDLHYEASLIIVLQFVLVDYD
jgi:hypothetical protein